MRTLPGEVRARFQYIVQRNRRRERGWRWMVRRVKQMVPLSGSHSTIASNWPAFRTVGGEGWPVFRLMGGGASFAVVLPVHGVSASAWMPPQRRPAEEWR